MLTGIHFLLTYKCIYECDHCFVYSSPNAEGTFTFNQFCETLDEAEKIGTIEWIYIEGGEPFLYYPLMIYCINEAAKRGFKTGLVTNAYFAVSEADAERWLEPLKEININDLSISNDTLHSGEMENSPSVIAVKAAKKLGINVNTISIIEPGKLCGNASAKGEPVSSGDVMFRGRAADKLAPEFLNNSNSGKQWDSLNECKFEELIAPERVHIDAYGYVHICQGISIGNIHREPLQEIIKNYDAYTHPIVKYILSGGPAILAEHYKTTHDEYYADACHLCYETRKQLLQFFPNQLAPKQVYGIS